MPVMKITVLLGCSLLPLLIPSALRAQSAKEALIQSLEASQATYAPIARQIWGYAELGYQETQSSQLLQQTLQEAGFSLEAGVAGMPTAFVATYGEGEPVIGLLAEFDALPGLSQDSVPERKAIEGKQAGHACGHHLFGTATVAAAISLKEWLAAHPRSGTLKVFGTPAEEGGAGKVYLVRAGLFEGVDAVLHWHPASRNDASARSSLANKSAKFRFYGQASHAAAAPERGRSALDGVEAMNYMVNLLREHVPEQSRIHYVITSGGEAPNVVPEFAEVYYYVRNPEVQNVMAIFERVVAAAEGAAQGTGTRMEYEVIHGLYNILPNEPLAKLMYENLKRVGGVTYHERERAFAEKIRATLGSGAMPLSQAQEVQPFRTTERGTGSTDVGDISWVVPTAGMAAATWVPGTSAHSWQAVAAGGTSIGLKGMLVAAKTLALTAYDLLQAPKILQAAKAELIRQAGEDFTYEALLGDREPPLDYRK